MVCDGMTDCPIPFGVRVRVRVLAIIGLTGVGVGRREGGWSSFVHWKGGPRDELGVFHSGVGVALVWVAPGLVGLGLSYPNYVGGRAGCVSPDPKGSPFTPCGGAGGWWVSDARLRFESTMPHVRRLRVYCVVIYILLV